MSAHRLRKSRICDRIDNAPPLLDFFVHTGGNQREITTKQLKRVDLVTVSGRIDSPAARELEGALRSIVDAGRFRICMDLKGLEYICSGGLRVLISILKTCKRWNRGDLRLANMPPRIAEVFELAGLTPLFKIYPNAVEAVGSF